MNRAHHLVALYQIFTALAFVALIPLGLWQDQAPDLTLLAPWLLAALVNLLAGAWLLKGRGLWLSALNLALQVPGLALGDSLGGWQYHYQGLLTLDLWYQWYGSFSGSGLRFALEPDWLLLAEPGLTQSLHLDLVALAALAGLGWGMKKPG